MRKSLRLIIEPRGIYLQSMFGSIYREKVKEGPREISCDRLKTIMKF